MLKNSLLQFIFYLFSLMVYVFGIIFCLFVIRLPSSQIILYSSQLISCSSRFILCSSRLILRCSHLILCCWNLLLLKVGRLCAAGGSFYLYVILYVVFSISFCFQYFSLMIIFPFSSYEFLYSVDSLGFPSLSKLTLLVKFPSLSYSIMLVFE